MKDSRRLRSVLVLFLLTGSAVPATGVQAQIDPDAPILGTAEELDPERFQVVRLTNVSVKPEVRGAAFRFIARPDAAPIVEIAAAPPAAGGAGLVYQQPLARFQVARDQESSSSIVTEYAGSSAPTGVRLEQGRAYHYLITVPGTGSIPTQQETGTFTTLMREVKVVFNFISIVNDSDVDDVGELGFTFYLNPRDPGDSPEEFRATPHPATTWMGNARTRR